MLLGFHSGGTIVPQTSRVEDGKVLSRPRRRSGEAREMSIMRRLSMPTQSGEFGPIRHNKSEHLRGCLKLSFKTDLICGETGIDRHTHVYFTRLNTMACVSVVDFSCSCWKSHICFHRDDRLKVKPPCHSLLNLCQHC